MSVVYDGRNSEEFAIGLNKVFRELGLPYRAELEREPRCYESPRHGYVCNSDYIPVYIVNENGRPVDARMDMKLVDSSGDECCGYGYSNSYYDALLEIRDGKRLVKLRLYITVSSRDYYFKVYVSLDKVLERRGV